MNKRKAQRMEIIISGAGDYSDDIAKSVITKILSFLDSDKEFDKNCIKQINWNECEYFEQ